MPAPTTPDEREEMREVLRIIRAAADPYPHEGEPIIWPPGTDWLREVWERAVGRA